MTATTTEARPRRSRHFSLAWIAPAIFAIAACVLIVNLSRSMPPRESISIENRTGAPVTVRASDDGRNGWLPITTIDARSTETVDAVIDQGDVWVFELTVGPDRVGELRRTSEQLRADDWKVTIPRATADRLPEARRPD